MKPRYLIPFVVFAMAATAFAQRNPAVPLLTPEEKLAVDAQTAAFNEALEPLLADAARSTVRVWSGNRRLAYGTVVGDGSRVVTKWSEIGRARGDLRIEAADSELRGVRVAGVYANEDLVLLELLGEPLHAISWYREEPGLGMFLAAPQPDGRPAAFGVVAVPARNLRETDQAFLGVMGDAGHDGDGVRIERVVEDSGAAAAGLLPGDVIRRVGGREVNGLFELRNSLNGVPPGEALELLVERNGETTTREVVLGGRPELPRFPGARLQQMERMGGPISRMRDRFPVAIETDMRPLPNQVGGPVVDSRGRPVGITLARAGRTRSYVMPAAALDDLLSTAAADPVEAAEQLAAANSGERHEGIHVPRAMPAPGGGGGNAPGPERLGRHLSDMQRLLDLMHEEMEALGR
jgi:hypothetical protein